jgi:hypothetical protein
MSKIEITTTAAKKWPAKRWAEIGIGIQWLALVRTLSEYFRQKHASGQVVSLPLAEHFLRGSLIAAVCLGTGVALYFVGRYRAAVGVVVVTVVLLLAYKIIFMSGG